MSVLLRHSPQLLEQRFDVDSTDSSKQFCIEVIHCVVYKLEAMNGVTEMQATQQLAEQTAALDAAEAAKTAGNNYFKNRELEKALQCYNEAVSVS